MGFTTDQLAAITSRGETLLLSAAAGSGKTTVLVERVLRLIREGADITRMLIVTFTRASAADMRLSLINKLEDAARDEPELSAQAEAAASAGISTLHSFCGDLLREHFQAADVDPTFRILDDSDAQELLTRAIDEAMNACYADMDADMTALTENRRADQVAGLIVTLYRAATNRPDPDAWMDEAVGHLERGEDIYTPVLAESAATLLDAAKAAALQARRLSSQAMGPEKMEKLAQGDLDMVNALFGLDYDALRSAVIKPTFARKPTVKGDKGNPGTEAYKAARDRVKKAIEAVAKALSVEREGALSDLGALAAETRALVRLVKATEAAFTRMKQQRRALTFDDLEHRALRILADQDVRLSLKARYSHILVDEYQDISDVQEAVLSALSRGDNMFFVGDVKQSIYRFRNAEPSLFQRKFEAFGRGEGGRLILLNENFRSRKTVLDFTNAVFERLMRGGASEITYDERAKLIYGGQYEGDDPPVDMTLIVEPDQPENEEEMDESAFIIGEMSKAQAEALAAAQIIRELVGQPTYDVKQKVWRPMRYRDIAILTRQARNVAGPIMETLRREGIPAYADLAGGYTEVMEVRVALSLLALCDNMRRDVEWLSVLRSPIVGLNSEALARIRLATPAPATYSEAVRRFAETDGTPVGEKVRSLVGRLDGWRRLKRHIPLGQFVFRVLDGSGLYAFVGAMKGGAQRQANLDILCDRAAAFDERSAEGLNGFVKYMQRAQYDGGDKGAAHILDENDDVVRLMTVHKSKGLEFQAVIGMMLGQSLTGHREDEPETHAALGIGLKHIDNALKTRRDTLPRLAIARKRAMESMAEEMRVLYVLLTRAKSRLVLIGTPKKKDVFDTAAMSALSPLPCDSWLDMLLPAMMRMPGAEPLHDACSATEPPPIDPTAPKVRVRLTTRADMSLTRGAEEDDVMARLSQVRYAEPDPRFAEAFQWTYPHADDVYLPLKLTASGLTRELTGPAQPPQIAPRPRFMQQAAAGLTGTERGTAMHNALMHIDLGALRGLAGEALTAQCRGQLDLMAERGQLTPAERAVVSPNTVAAFFSRGAGARMLAADTVRREWMFTLAMTAREALGLDSDETVMVQGSIDCCFIEDGQWVLIDYKTDRDEGDQALIERYAPQLKLYKTALERITHITVSDARLCLVRAGREIELK